MHSKEICPFVFFLGLLAFNYPFIDLARPFLPYYLYAAWAVVILVTGILVTIKEGRRKKQYG